MDDVGHAVGLMNSDRWKKKEGEWVLVSLEWSGWKGDWARRRSKKSEGEKGGVWEYWQIEGLSLLVCSPPPL